jgi:hypothetical protein
MTGKILIVIGILVVWPMVTMSLTWLACMPWP